MKEKVASAYDFLDSFEMFWENIVNSWLKMSLSQR